MIGAKELIKTMNFNGSKTILISGGFTFLTDHLKNILGFSHSHANSLEIIQAKGKFLNFLEKLKALSRKRF